MSVHRYISAAQNIAQAIPGILAEQGLDPLINRFVSGQRSEPGRYQYRNHCRAGNY